MKVRSDDGVLISYQVMGIGNPTLVFVHGWCCDKSYWDSQVSHFALTHKVVTIDLAGHGESGVERDRWTMAAFGGDVATVVNQLALERVVLIGHSMGGNVVIEAAQRIRERVLGIVGVDTFRDVNRNGVRVSLDERLAPSRANFVEATRSFVTSMFVKTSDPILVDRIVSDMSSAPPSVGIGTMEGIFNQDLAQAFNKTQVPIRCICSDYRPFDLEAAQHHAASFQVVFMPGVGHFIMLEDPATFNSLLEGVIEEFVV